MNHTQLEILLPTSAPHGFDYRAETTLALSAGDYVRVPFGRGESLGVVWGPGVAQLPAGKLKSVQRAFPDVPALSASMREFIDFAAWYNCVPKGAILKMVVPLDDIDKTARTPPPVHTPDPTQMKPPVLSATQQEAASVLTKKLSQGFSVTLLDGVTGSGKTEVYFDMVAELLQRDDQSQALILLPEIALSVQSLDRFEARFGFKPVIWNSEITLARKRAGWQAIAKGTARVVIGARSALFLPYRHLSAIIVDEEHDASYKQEEGVIYHARDMAVTRARFEKIPVLLVSATPSLESYHNVQQGRYGELLLPARHGQAVMPATVMLDMRQPITERGAFISNPLREQLAQALGSGHQAMLFLNRRGYAPLMLCRTCGHRFQCAECSSWLVLHKKGGGSAQRLECHHCGHREPVPETCPACQATDSLHACGPGVERLHEEVRAVFPQARVAVMASDSMDSFNNLSETIYAMENRQIDLLIGTQMMAKGHHFAGLSVVGVVDADLGLAGGDLRAAERTYQLLHQLSGRAGREDIPGTVYLQSFLPDHPVMQALLDGGRDAFLAAELAARQDANMPPFSRLAAIIIEGPKEEQVMKLSRQLAASADPAKGLQILGPSPAPLYLLRGRYRYRLLVKADRELNLPNFMRRWVDTAALPSSLKVKIDMDPISFL
ncbi:MAG: primosomal protein N' [Rickettsiales bacterium]|nr:primosomal protein N' [Rickettsiales bacterium]